MLEEQNKELAENTEQSEPVKVVRPKYKNLMCDVVSNDTAKHIVTVKFKGYQVRIQNAYIDNDMKKVAVRYKGEIGKPTFECYI